LAGRGWEISGFEKKVLTLTWDPHRTGFPLQGRRVIQLGAQKINLGLPIKGTQNRAQLSASLWMRAKSQGRRPSFEIGPENGPDVVKN